MKPYSEMTEEEIEKQRAYARECYRKNKDRYLAQKKEYYLTVREKRKQQYLDRKALGNETPKIEAQKPI